MGMGIGMGMGTGMGMGMGTGTGMGMGMAWVWVWVWVWVQVYGYGYGYGFEVSVVYPVNVLLFQNTVMFITEETKDDGSLVKYEYECTNKTFPSYIKIGKSCLAK